jgi:hypothetical protein
MRGSEEVDASQSSSEDDDDHDGRLSVLYVRVQIYSTLVETCICNDV